MAENTSPTPMDPVPNDPAPADAANAGGPVDPKAAPAKRRRRLWPKIVVGVIAALVLVVALLPTIVSSGMVRRYVVGKINDNLNGTVEITDWSVGWASGIELRGIRVLDAEKRSIIEIARVRSALTLLNAARGNYDLGDTVVDDPNLVDLVRYQDRTTNLQHLVKESPKKEGESKSTAGKKTAESPRVKVNLHINRPRGRMTDESLHQQFVLDPASDVVVKVTSLDQPIENVISLVVGIGSENGRGTIKLAGSASLGNGPTNEKLDITTFPLAGISPLLDKSGQNKSILTGIASGSLAITLSSTQQLAVEGQLAVANLAFGNEAMQGEVYHTTKLNVPIKITRTAGDASTAVLKVETLKVETDQFTASATVDTTEAALENLGGNLPPGREGHIGVAVAVNDVPSLIKQLPKTLRLAPGASVTGGRIEQTADVWLFADRAVVKGHTDIRDIAGTQDGKPIVLRPVSQTLDATIRPTGAAGQIPDLRNFSLTFDSGFATIKGNGKTLAEVNLDGTFNLPDARKELGQFVDLSSTKLEGTVEFAVRTEGDPTKPTAPIKSSATIGFHTVKVGIPGTGDLSIASADFSAGGYLLRDADGAITAVDQLEAHLRAGDPAALTLEALIKGRLDTVRVPASLKNGEKIAAKTAWNARGLDTLLTVDLPAAQRDFGAFLPFLKKNGLDLTGGNLVVTGIADYTGTKLSLDASKPLSAKLQNVTLRQGTGSAALEVLKNETIALTTAGAVDLAPTGTSIDLSNLALTSSSGLISLHKSADKDFAFRVTEAGGVRGRGTLELTGDLKKINDLAASFGTGKQVVVSGPKVGDIRGGKLSGSIVLADAANNATSMNANLVLENLGITTYTAPIEGEKVTIALRATTPDDYSALQASGSVTGSFFTATIKSSQLRLAAPGGKTAQPLGDWEKIAQAQLEVSLPDLVKANDYAQRLQAPTTQPAAALAVNGAAPATQPAPLPPVKIRSGSAVVRLDISRDVAGRKTVVQNGELLVNNLAFDRGDGHYPPENNPAAQSVRFSADIDAGADAAISKKTITEQIRRITLTSLDGNLAGGVLKMPDRISITGFGGAMAATGSIVLAGKVHDLTDLLEAFQGKKRGTAYPYTGDYTLAEKVTSTGDTLALAGGMTVDNFVMQNPGDPQPSFAEKQLMLTNDLIYDTAKQSVRLTNVALDTKASDALHLAVTGGINGLGAEQSFDKLQISLGYDLEKVWPLIKPMLTPATQEDLKEFVIRGKQTRLFSVRGNYPSGKPFNEAIKTVIAGGSLIVDHVEVYGMVMDKVELPLALENGIGYTLYADRPKGQKVPPPIACNGGQINIGAIAIDLTSDSPRLSIPKGQKLVEHVTINPLLSDKLGQYVNPVLANAKRAQGLLDVTVNYCQGLALGAAMKTRDSGAAQLTYTVQDLDVVNPFGSLMFGQVASVLKPVAPDIARALGGNNSQADTFDGTITNAVVTIDRGKAKVDTTLQLVENLPPPTTAPAAGQPRVAAAKVVKPKQLPFSFAGGLDLENLEMSFNASLPTGLVTKLISSFPGANNTAGITSILATAFPDGIPFTIRGTPKAPKISFDAELLLKRFAEGQVKSRLGNVIGGNDPLGNIIKGGNDKDKKQGGDVIGDILGGLTGDKKKGKDKDTPVVPQRDPDPAAANPPTPQPPPATAPTRGRTGRSHPATAPAAPTPD